MSSDVFVDGLGVVADEPLPEGTRIRFRIDPADPGRDLTAHVEHGQLLVSGFRYPVAFARVTPAVVAVRTVPL
jgi:hypothetical protein